MTEESGLVPAAPTQLAPRETATTAQAAYAETNVKARFQLALARPRDIDEVRARVLKDCKRPGFSRTARYRRKVGRDFIEGPSVRFVEAALRAYGNVLPEAIVQYEDHEKRIVKITITDLESNVTYGKDIVI